MKLRYLLLFSFAIIATFGMVSLPKANAVSPSSILVKISPENPTPNQNTTISLSSYSSNLDSVTITWFLDGKNTLSGIGKKSFSVNAPSSGKEIVVRVVVSLPDGEIEKTIPIRPASTTLLWQANDSYVPPFYKGKALPTPDSEIKIIAIPEIKSGSQIVDYRNLVYAWKQDYTNMQDASGYGKNYFTYVNDYLENSSNVSVVASTTDQKYSSSANIDVGTSEVKMLFYKNDNILGTIWDSALSDGYKIEGDAIIEAAPYFISPNDLRIPVLTWVWSINNNTIETPIFKKYSIPLKTQEGVSGRAKINLNIENKYRIFGTASGEINVTF